MKIAIYAPMKDEEKNIKSWVDSCREADYIVVGDTGSADKTRQLLFLSDRVNVHRICIDPWRFDDAHNAVLALVPGDAEVCIPLHADERLNEGWRERIEKAWEQGHTSKLYYPYQFSPTLTFMQNRIHGRKGFRWLYPDHEGIYPYFGQRDETAWIHGPPLITQFQDPGKDRSHILGRLAWAVKEHPQSARMAYYYGRELMYYQRWDAAITQLQRYFQLPGQWPGEAAKVAECLAHCYSNKK